MFDQNGLSLDQAPPISVIFRFFFAGGLFGILLGILILLFRTSLFDASTTGALIVTHTLTLGIMLSFMFAALFQMLPVIAGVTLTSPVKKANLLQYPFSLGILLLLLGFYFSSAWLFILSSLLLGGSILFITLVMVKNLSQLSNHTSSSKGMLIALLALGILTLLGLYMTGTLAGIFDGSVYTQVKTAHYSFGLFGWIALLIISISFQVIEMFYVTPPYPNRLNKYLTPALFIILLSSSIVSFIYPAIWSYSNILLMLLLGMYALITLRRLSQKKRPLSDATVWFWRVGLGSLLLSILFIMLTAFSSSAIIKSLSYIFFTAFALSIVFAMFYKIVPFLTWFHLNSQGYFTAPMMHEVIHPKTAMRHLYIHLSTIVTLVLSLFIAPLIFLAGILTIISFTWMTYQIMHAWKLYKHTQETGEKFEMGSM